MNQFCYYCDKEYDHQDTLMEHQRDRHFSCLKCPKKFSTANSMSTHMLSVHRETLARVPNAKVGRDNLDVNIYGMEGVPTSIIQEKLISKLKKKRQQLQEDMQKNMNLNQKLNPKNIKELKESNEFFDIFKAYTTNMEAAAGIKYYTEQQPAQSYSQMYPPPPGEEEKGKLEAKRDSKFQSKLEEEGKSALPMIMKEEMKEKHMWELYEEPAMPRTNLNINKRVEGQTALPTPNLNVAQPKDKKKGKQEIMTFVSKLSPEEKQAKMDKYRYDEKKIMSKLANLKMNIADRLNALK